MICSPVSGMHATVPFLMRKAWQQDNCYKQKQVNPGLKLDSDEKVGLQ